MNAKQCEYRKETDSIGVKDVPKEAYYGVQSLRAAENFRITGLHIHPEMIRSMADIKEAAPLTNYEHGELDEPIDKAVICACREMKEGKFDEKDIENAKNLIVESVQSIPSQQDTEITYYYGQELSDTFCRVWSLFQSDPVFLDSP